MNAIAIACRQHAALLPIPIAPMARAKRPKMAIYILAHTFPVCSLRPSEEELAFGTARECLETLGNYGNGNSKRFAEIIAATAMAGEISLMTSIVNGTYIYAHETFARNRPPSKGERVAEGI